MWALRGPVSATERRFRSAMLPPAAPTTQLSTARTQVGRPMTRSERTTGRPRLTTETFELVPPHSTTIASESPSWCSAAATPAAGPGADREAGPAAEGVDAHGAAVAAEHEQRHVEAGVLQRLLDDGGRALDDGEDARVHGGADGAHLEAVRAGEVVADAGRAARVRARSARPGARASGSSTARAPLTATAAQPAAASAVERGVDVVLVEAAGGVDEGVLGLERVPGRERDGADLRPLARGAEVGRGADAEDADPADVALEQRVHRLCRREGDQRDAARGLAELGEERAQRVGDALGDARSARVRGRDRRVRQQPQRRGLDRDGLGEGAADVDADPDRAAHALTACAVRRRHGLIAKTQAAPRT